MKFLLSDWLRRMVVKSSPLPEARIVNLFVILEGLLDAPGMREQLLAGGLDTATHNELTAFLQFMAEEAGLQEPDKLAFQLCFILLGALNEELRNPGCQTMAKATAAASGLVTAANAPRFPRMQSWAALCAVLFVLVAGSLLVFTPSRNKPVEPVVVATVTLPAAKVTMNFVEPAKLDAIYQMHDKMRSGQCSYPQALMLDAPQRATFLNGVVNIEDLNSAKTNLEEVIQLYQKVDCYYPPAAMLL